MVKLLAVQNNCLARMGDASAPPVLSQGGNANSNSLASLSISRMSLVDGKSLETGLSLHFASRTGKLWPVLVVADESGAVDNTTYITTASTSLSGAAAGLLKAGQVVSLYEFSCDLR